MLQKFSNKSLLKYIIIIGLTMIITATSTTLFFKFYYASNKDFSKLMKINDLIDYKYFTDVDNEKLLEGAVNGMLEALDDPYSQYYDSANADIYLNALENTYVGIGIELAEVSKQVYIAKVYDGTSAKDVGLKRGDLITKIDGKDVQNIGFNKLQEKLQSSKNRAVDITVLRNRKSLTFTVLKKDVKLDDLSSGLLTNKIGYIEIKDFTSTVAKQFKIVYDSLVAEGMQQLIIDVRNNGGGYLDQVYEIIDLFVDDSKPIYQEETRDEIKLKKFGNSKKVATEVVLLANENSASASEVLLSALNEINGSKIVGVSTFGKGVAQKSVGYFDGSIIKYTYAKWLTPDGNWIQDQGIKPDVEEELAKCYTYSYIFASEVLKFDSVSQQNLNAQNILNLIGYDVRDDGYFDLKMESQIKLYQQTNDLKVNGKLDYATVNSLNDDLDKYLNDYQHDNQIMKAIEVLKHG